MDALATLAALLQLGTAVGTGSFTQFAIPLAGNAEQSHVQYSCEGVEQPVSVVYINSQPNFLAILTVDGLPTIFVTTISASGARYVSGPYEWWSTGGEATFTDIRIEPAASITCTQTEDTP